MSYISRVIRTNLTHRCVIVHICAILCDRISICSRLSHFDSFMHRLIHFTYIAFIGDELKDQHNSYYTIEMLRSYVLNYII